MKNTKPVFGLAVFVAMSIALSSVIPAMASTPQAASAAVGSLVQQIDNVYGYQILRPAAWSSADLGDGRSYSLAADGNLPTLTLTVTNLKTIGVAYAGQAVVANYQAFQNASSFADWMRGTEVMWSTNGIAYERIRQLPNAAIYAVTTSSGTVQLVGFKISRGEPLGLSLEARSPYDLGADLEVSDLLKDFVTMSVSLSAAEASMPTLADASRVVGTAIQPDSVGPYHRDSGYRYLGASTYRLKTDFYQAPPEVSWMYEYLYYSLYQSNRSWWLYRADITNYPQNSCASGGWDLIYRSINRVISPSTGVVTDSYYPNAIVNLQTTTAHMMVFGNPLVVNCMWYTPFYL